MTGPNHYNQYDHQDQNYVDHKENYVDHNEQVSTLEFKKNQLLLSLARFH